MDNPECAPAQWHCHVHMHAPVGIAPEKPPHFRPRIRIRIRMKVAIPFARELGSTGQDVSTSTGHANIYVYMDVWFAPGTRKFHQNFQAKVMTEFYIFRIIQWNLLKPKNSKTILIVVDFHKKKIQESPEICGCFKLKLLKSTLFRNHLAREIFALDASNWLKSVVSVFLNYLPDFYLITNKLGGWRASPLNGANEIYARCKRSAKKMYITKNMMLKSKWLAKQWW